MPGYNVSDIFIDNGNLYFIIDGKKIKLDIPSDIVVTDDLIMQYRAPGPLNIIDEHGMGVCEHLRYRPFALPPGSRRPLQWEFDKFYYDNPDPESPIDLNALLYKMHIEKNSF